MCRLNSSTVRFRHAWTASAAYGWWSRPEDRRYVLHETVKLAGYRAILSMPEWAIRLLMPLKD